MTEFKVGDKIRHVNKQEHDDYQRTIAYVGPKVVVYSVHKEADRVHSQHAIYPWCDGLTDFELVPELFEVGKAYRAGPTGYTRFACIFADDKVALMNTGTPGGYHIILQSERSRYEERA